MIVDLMIHDFDFARCLAGDVERVFARRSRSEQGAAEYAQAILRFKSGAIGLIEGGLKVALAAYESDQLHRPVTIESRGRHQS
ncbi:MAG TPA: Gfo/Idh/MocA family oxidoreductase [Chthoniobacterales bacterium]|jgi:predicted dehydrogenase|nr:Gfo/Idh/MocA family oxidoreductase [Chthoniobacterales bacterium]